LVVKKDVVSEIVKSFLIEAIDISAMFKLARHRECNYKSDQLALEQ